MLTLGIETSCDETGASVVDNGTLICSNITASSLKEHSCYGGVIPEIASRAHLECITPVVDEALKKAGVSLSRIGLIAVTKGPGLIGSLLVGISFAKSIGFASGIPVLGIDHVRAHLYASFLRNAHRRACPRFPFIGLIVSGGHTSLFECRSFSHFSLIGQTSDDAAGEAFDKAAKLLELGYPGGPLIERLALKGNSRAYPFRCVSEQPFQFSFSGIKTAVLYKLNDMKRHGEVRQQQSRDVAASFQKSVVDALIETTLDAARRKKINTIVIGGGVAANSHFRTTLAERAHLEGKKVFIPEKSLCTDNAAIIAGFGYQLFRLGKRDTFGFKPMLH